MKLESAVTRDTDLLLWQDIENNNDVAFERLFRKYWEPLVQFTSAYLPNRQEREEVLQELFIELFQKRGRIKIQASVYAYLLTGARNRIYNYLRSRNIYKRHLATASEGHFNWNQDTEATIDFRETRERIHSELARIPVKYRQVYILIREYQLPVYKAARILNRPVDTVEKQLKKALASLRDAFRDSN